LILIGIIAINIQIKNLISCAMGVLFFRRFGIAGTELIGVKIRLIKLERVNIQYWL
jgi:hypothetical protein